MQYPDVFLSIETSKGLYSNRDIPVWEPAIWDKFPTLPENIILYKILASSGQKPLYEGIETTLTDDVYHTIANNDLIQIMSKEATKWNGIKQMLSHFGVSPSEAVYTADEQRRTHIASPYARGGDFLSVQAFLPARDLRYFSLSQLAMNFFAASPMVDSS